MFLQELFTSTDSRVNIQDRFFTVGHFTHLPLNRVNTSVPSWNSWGHPLPPFQEDHFLKRHKCFLFKQGIESQGAEKLAQSNLRKPKIGKKKSTGVNEAAGLELSPWRGVIAGTSIETSELSSACALVHRHLGF